MQEERSLETVGQYPTEDESVDHFDKLVAQTGLFTIEKQVQGYLLHPRPGAKPKGMRIDRLLLPRSELISMGWKRGVLGVECKRSGEKVGPAVAQMMDYVRSAWVSSKSGLTVMVNYVFLWPMDEVTGTLHSILQQGRIGGVYLRCDQFGEALSFHQGHRTCIFEYKVGTGAVYLGNSKAGAKAGRR